MGDLERISRMGGGALPDSRNYSGGSGFALNRMVRRAMRSQQFAQGMSVEDHMALAAYKADVEAAKAVHLTGNKLAAMRVQNQDALKHAEALGELKRGQRRKDVLSERNLKEDLQRYQDVKGEAPEHPHTGPAEASGPIDVSGMMPGEEFVKRAAAPSKKSPEDQKRGKERALKSHKAREEAAAASRSAKAAEMASASERASSAEHEPFTTPQSELAISQKRAELGIKGKAVHTEPTEESPFGTTEWL